MKLEVGMYCRTEDGYIFKYSKENNINFNEINNTYYILIDNGECDDCDVIKKFDYNIIDLIEKHDILKHDILHILEVKEIDKENEKIYFYNLSWGLNIEDLQKAFELNTIKILTHEQFENNCYKIGDE